MSFTSVSVTVLFWVSVVGIAAVLASVAGVIGIAATFDEHTDSANGFDTLCTASQQIVGICFVVALLAHGITAIWRIWPKKEAVL